ncbi:type I-C CRISPR-associated protein Cas8c/Csd1 [Proteinivorax hydrogeniformans]|uniref:Type I-C CRISPR-associated protein Cas8c/Csd1 n=1 Tax=Proteinivorax hydrogeniformans TaxID=1826727 RepID=A0AAU8HW18_9FIRM
MGWMNDLLETYENNVNQVGKFEQKGDKEFTLIPIAHTTQYAQIEVTVDVNGDFLQAKVVDKDNANTVIPCTESSSSRTSAPAPHPLHDKLIYVAGDFEKYVGKLKKSSPHNNYIDQLKKWCDSDYANYKVKAIYQYIQKGTLIRDLISASVLVGDKNNVLITKWSKELEKNLGYKPAIFEVLSETQDKAFVRFDVHQPNTINKKVWKDKKVYDSFISFYKNRLEKEDTCYITGEVTPKTETHLSGLRRSGDKAKLISANDTSGFTFRGRFNKGGEAVSISYDVSQKAHNALKWLILKQGKSIDGRVFLVWGNENTDAPSPQDDALTLLSQLDPNLTVSNSLQVNTHEIFADDVNKAIDGYKRELSYNSNIIIMIFDAATPGRLSIKYYQNLKESEYIKRIQKWHNTCSWLHRYRKSNEGKHIKFCGAPATRDIANAAFGFKSSDKLIKETMERMLPCVIEGRKIPIDIIRSAIYRASNPVSMEKWQWEKTLSITCALLKKHYEKEGYEVALDEKNKSRDYLFGRLLAVADVLERRALSKEEGRPTSALRYMNAFARHPARTWKTIQTNLQPYQAKLGNKGIYYNRLIDEIASNISLEDFNNRALGGVYLLGFYSQRHELYNGKNDV